MLNLFEYPIMITVEDISNYLDINLASEVDSVKVFMNTVHSHIYDYLIYPTGNRDIKNRTINKYKEELEKPLKNALLLQADYLLSNGSNIGKWNGVLRSSGGVDEKERASIASKVICPESINMLLSTQPEILYAGGDE